MFKNAQPLARSWRLSKVYYARFSKAEIFTRAAAMAFNTMLAVVPTVGLLFWYLVKIGVTQRWLELTKRYILAQLSVDSEGKIESTFQALTLAIEKGAWNWVGLGVLLYTSITLLFQFSYSLDVVIGMSGTVPKKRVSFFLVMLHRLAVMLGLPVALTFSVVITNWIRQDSWFHWVTRVHTVGSLVALVIPWTVDILVFFLVYYFIPTVTPPWRQALKAALIVGPVSEISRYIFSFYGSYAVSVHKIYGVLAAIPLFILWVQVAWVIVLTGALFIRHPKVAPANADPLDPNYSLAV